MATQRTPLPYWLIAPILRGSGEVWIGVALWIAIGALVTAAIMQARHRTTWKGALLGAASGKGEDIARGALIGAAAIQEGIVYHPYEDVAAYMREELARCPLEKLADLLFDKSNGMLGAAKAEQLKEAASRSFGSTEP